jgi:hypothetical protein
MKRHVVVALISLLGFIQCPTVFGAEAIPKATIQIERTICYGSCPAYTITINEDGEITWHGQSYVAQKGERSIRVDPKVFKSALALLEKAEFRSFATRYQRGERDGCKSLVTDSPDAVITVKTSAYEHRVWHYHGCEGFPRESELINLEDELDELLGSERWIVNQKPLTKRSSGRSKTRAAER